MSGKLSPVEIAGQLADLWKTVGDQRDQINGLTAQVKLLEQSKRPFDGDDSAFMIWTLGFTAGCHMSKSGEDGPVIFSRARALYMKQFPGAGPLSPGANPS